MKKSKVNKADLVVLFLGILVVWMGADALLVEAQEISFATVDWIFALVAVIFGSMLSGVAVNKISQAYKDKAGSVKSTKNGKRKAS